LTYSTLIYALKLVAVTYPPTLIPFVFAVTAPPRSTTITSHLCLSHPLPSLSLRSTKISQYWLGMCKGIIVCVINQSVCLFLFDGKFPRNCFEIITPSLPLSQSLPMPACLCRVFFLSRSPEVGTPRDSPDFGRGKKTPRDHGVPTSGQEKNAAYERNGTTTRIGVAAAGWTLDSVCF
jgi:hypothetical protein